MSYTIDIDVEEMLADYAFSAPVGAVKQFEYRLSEGDGVDQARQRAANWAISQISASDTDMERLVYRMLYQRHITDQLIQLISSEYDIELPEDFDSISSNHNDS